MIECHAGLSRLAPHLHLPVQSGSAKVLKKMKRYVPIETYVGRLEALRARMPGINITTDLIVGFPDETEEDFERTLDLMKRIRYDNLYCYTYSPRPGTAALALGDTVPEPVKKARHAKLKDLQAQIQLEKNQARIGRVEEVLCEGPSRTDPDVACGRTPGGLATNFTLPAGVSPASVEGRFLPVKIVNCNSYVLKGEVELL
jgi:tRNA-2-methylthio-N6-dimethylallyladenosine synthase